jgi:hypothetical protein
MTKPLFMQLPNCQGLHEPKARWLVLRMEYWPYSL